LQPFFKRKIPTGEYRCGQQPEASLHAQAAEVFKCNSHQTA
jgi:hypothetical protein